MYISTSCTKETLEHGKVNNHAGDHISFYLSLGIIIARDLASETSERANKACRAGPIHKGANVMKKAGMQQPNECSFRVLMTMSAAQSKGGAREGAFSQACCHPSIICTYNTLALYLYKAFFTRCIP